MESCSVYGEQGNARPRTQSRTNPAEPETTLNYEVRAKIPRIQSFDSSHLERLSLAQSTSVLLKGGALQAREVERSLRVTPPIPVTRLMPERPQGIACQRGAMGSRVSLLQALRQVSDWAEIRMVPNDVPPETLSFLHRSRKSTTKAQSGPQKQLPPPHRLSFLYELRTQGKSTAQDGPVESVRFLPRKSKDDKQDKKGDGVCGGGALGDCLPRTRRLESRGKLVHG